MANTNDDQPASSAAEGAAPQTGFTLTQEPIIGIEIGVAKYEVAPEPAVAPAPVDEQDELPATYNYDTLFLTARDPRWLFCYWDFDWSKIPSGAFRYGAPMFFLKITRTSGAGEATIEIKPEARNWYVPVSSPATSYFAELGFYNNEGSFVSCVRSGTATTPAESLAEGSEPVQFATAPATLSFEQMLDLVRSQMSEGETLLGAVARITGQGTIAFRSGLAPTWSDEQRRILAALLGSSLVDRAGLGSAELDELIRKSLSERLHSENASGLGAVWQRALGYGGESSLFSGFGAWSGVTSWGASWSAQPFGARVERGFFMHVNAEIIFYGGTHPDATVWIDGKQVRLNPDGTFRYHTRLPDGDWRIPVVAQSPDKIEQRSATLSFKRGTQRTGEVGATAQPQELASEPMGRK
ncbi:MAG: DUF4912 domain-containing protein [Chthoniobacteraceae bacterium]